MPAPAHPFLFCLFVFLAGIQHKRFIVWIEAKLLGEFMLAFIAWEQPPYLDEVSRDSVSS
jgi:hypothetical protein